MVGTSTDLCSARLGPMGTAVLHSGPGVFCTVIQLGLQTSKRHIRHKLSKQSQRGSCSPAQIGTCPVFSRLHSVTRTQCCGVQGSRAWQLLLGHKEGLERWLILQLLQGCLLLILPLLPVPGYNRGWASLHMPCPQVSYFLIPQQVLPSSKAVIALRLTLVIP